MLPTELGPYGSADHWQVWAWVRICRLVDLYISTHQLTAISFRLWIASGHQVWGIHNGPATGKVMVRCPVSSLVMHPIIHFLNHAEHQYFQAELILDRKASCCDVSSLQP